MVYYLYYLDILTEPELLALTADELHTLCEGYMTNRGISLTRAEQKRTFVKWRGDAFRLHIQAHDNILMPKEIFAHERRLVDPHAGEVQDDFVCICSPFDCTIYPKNAPDPQQLPQFFRKSVADFLVVSQEMAMDTWTKIHEQVCRLVAAYDNLDVLIEAETVRCGVAIPEEEPSLSESESESE